MLSLAIALALFLGGESTAARQGVDATDVFSGGEGGYPVYRIPAATVLRSPVGAEGATGHPGRVLVFAEGRNHLSDNGTHDIVLRTSDDSGATWSPVRTLRDEPGRSLANPTVVELARGAHAGRVLLVYQSYPTGQGEHSIKPGWDGDEVARVWVMHSDDGGDSWGEPRDITRHVKRREVVTSVASGPGVGIQLREGAHAGRVVVPFNQGPYGEWLVYAAHSDDGGDTWSIGECAPGSERDVPAAAGTPATENTSPTPTTRRVGRANEVQMVEARGGVIVLNARHFGGTKHRLSARSEDGGKTWSPLALVDDLPAPNCMGGLVRVDEARWVYTAPNSEGERHRGTVWESRDDGDSWQIVSEIEPGFFAYSVPVVLGGGGVARRVSVVYEGDGYKRIRLAAADTRRDH
ncbi:MAG: sialidase family protein [Planctomycetota bacterium]|nr:sialidase family protein [Planctomycetota bacterium]MDA1106708.1 sialidase family protein [Planctomycetota bacterium]